ncbi:hypothetical protein [Halococcus sediminicola]|uniref:hypothetical protein n=1 Tax=Halococcus sediminicola TaxID=1264579 RepID=UPI000679C096|nr:hypothetical protein [Halococcus sediminicola]
MNSEKEWTATPIEYLTPDGEWEKDGDARFGSISMAIQSRGEVSRNELLRIGRWKNRNRRNDRLVHRNDEESVTRLTRTALQAHDPVVAVETLSRLDGVRVPIASTVLTVADPETYAIIDYRALRALIAVRPDLAATDSYATFAEFLEHFRNYQKRPRTYDFYLNEVWAIADERDFTPREVDMALWALDKHTV